MRLLDFFHRGNAHYLEEMQARFKRDPQSVSPDWQWFFAGFEAGAASPPAQAASEVASRPAGNAADLVHSYRELGHCIARLDPLGHDRPRHPLLQLGEFGFSEANLDQPAPVTSFLGPPAATLRELVAQLESTYCGAIGVEYMGITDKEQRDWLQEQMESVLNRPEFSAAESRRILELLIDAETFEHFLQLKFIGQKRFSVEGAESLLPLLDTLVEHGATLGAEELVMGMTHRGRLNVLAHIMHKPYEIILSEFIGTVMPQTPAGEGDVKHHLGYSYDRITTNGRRIHCSLSANPSHLELIDPVIEGVVRAKQERLGDDQRRRVVPVLIHGEAAFTGQGIVAETLCLSELPAYRTGGTIHIIVNNQVGFTATPAQTRFTPYPTDVAKIIQAPIFHVNGDDPEAVVHAARLAIGFRQRFNTDALIDLWCYRRHGHNETDDPTFTQPVMYAEIEKHPPVTKSYGEKLSASSQTTSQEVEQVAQRVRQRLDEALKRARELSPRQKIHSLGGLWEGLCRAGTDWAAKTAVQLDVLRHITEAAARLPSDFALHPKLKRLFEARTAMAAGQEAVDWGCAEMWAIGSLLLERTAVRLAGQDVERGTFSQRHAVLHDSNAGGCYVPLANLTADQAKFTVVNTMLSELAVLGFEYGYSAADPRTLVIWEAQFGDFANAAQPIVDQFIAAAESKWQRMSGLVMLLPHGYEGQGPEHSSARLERYLQLCADNNMQVCYPTNPAQYFHLLRRQMHRNFRKPLIVMTPKSLLRLDRSTSRLADFCESEFRLIIDDPIAPPRDEVRRLILCSGRLYFALEAARQQRQASQVAIVRIEQLYPFPVPELQAIIAHYRRVQEVYWVQEEPRNMGTWSFMEPRLRDLLPDTCVLSYEGRAEAASPATGSFRLHQVEERALLERTFEGLARQPTAASLSPGDGAPTK